VSELRHDTFVERIANVILRAGQGLAVLAVILGVIDAAQDHPIVWWHFFDLTLMGLFKALWVWGPCRVTYYVLTGR
jgi:hypothetical protein